MELSAGPLILFDLWAAAKVLAETFDAPLAELGLHGRDLAALSVLEARGPTTPTEIASWTGMPAPSVTSLLRRLESGGLIAKQPNPQDGRSYRVELTQAGRDAQRRATRAFLDGWTRIEANLDVSASDVGLALRALDDALRAAAGLPKRPDPTALRHAPVHTLAYDGEELSADEQTAVARYIQRLRRKR